MVYKISHSGDAVFTKNENCVYKEDASMKLHLFASFFGSLEIANNELNNLWYKLLRSKIDLSGKSLSATLTQFNQEMFQRNLQEDKINPAGLHVSLVSATGSMFHIYQVGLACCCKVSSGELVQIISEDKIYEGVPNCALGLLPDLNISRRSIVLNEAEQVLILHQMKDEEKKLLLHGFPYNSQDDLSEKIDQSFSSTTKLMQITLEKADKLSWL
jgi:hypothetical protein